MHAMAGPIVKRDITLPNAEELQELFGKPPVAFTLDNIYTTEECEEYIRATEERGYEKALVNIGRGIQGFRPEARLSSRCIWDSTERANEFWRRIKDYIPETYANRRVLGLNERLRILRYDPGGYFKPHYDGAYMRENGERSYLTAHLYLNEGYKGGETTFVSHSNIYEDRTEGPHEGDVAVVPKTGSVLVFQHPLCHEGSQLFEGRKYTIRTDVMYSAEEITDN